MILLYVLLVFACAFIIESRYAEHFLKKLRYQGDLDRDLAEPDQILTLTSTVRNTGRLPIFYVSLMEMLPEEVCPAEDEDWQRRYQITPEHGVCSKSPLYLLPHRRSTRSVRFSLSKRGCYQMGRYYLSVGDYLGFHTRYQAGDLRKKVVVMPRRWEDPRLALTLGGYLGEISVRRFLFEDPVLTIGVREYTGSEPLKQISWKQTARTGTLQVKNYDYTVDANVTVLLNLDGSPAEQELSYRMARTVCEALERRRIPYEFFSNGDLFGPKGEHQWFPEGLGKQHYRTLMYALGQSKGIVYFSFPRMIERCVQKRRRSRGYILISPPLLRERDREALRALRRCSETEPCLLTARAEEGGAAS